MSGMFDDIRPLRRGTPCGVEVLLGQLEDADRDSFARALLDPSKPTSRIGATARAHGYAIGDETLGRHRRGICACEKEAS